MSSCPPDPRAAIVEAAAQVLAADGPDRFTVEAVAARAGVDIDALHQYFPNRDALTVALIQRETQRFRRELAAALDQRTAKATLELVISATVRLQWQRPGLARLLDAADERPALRGEVSDAELRRLFTEIVTQLIFPDHVRVDVVASDLFAMIVGMVDAAAGRGETDIPFLEHRLRAAVFGYLARVGKRRL
ncbi:TetR/AcrR family transcriptional regulator [Cupriavidus pauculus]|uniref:TetR/AcrR family transcriptional regulator n=1 Tax=Cupriavidus pauculus TaxID=82633 RepID=A0A3G8H895_9BURK|nr:TetR/AcrR family transcriptional regulator [Cupriavidus pauculus]AZG16310.1 TetR/AcrR family transcriptional regulator [Cupriavidus pauculus]